MINILIFTHGEFGSEVLRTATGIIGGQSNVYVFSLRLEDSLSSVSVDIKEMLGKISGEDGTLILTDMAGGTPSNASMPFSRDYKIEIITGLNLYMLISALMNRPHMKLKELSAKVLEDAKKNITDAKAAFLDKIK